MAASTSSEPGTRTLFETRLHSPVDLRMEIIDILNHRLADTLDLYSQTKQAHWNVKGEEFFQLHLLFDKLAEVVENHVDLLAERATALGGRAHGTVRMSAATSMFEDLPLGVHDGLELVELLSDRYAAFANVLSDDARRAEELSDLFTQDLFTQMGREIERSLYFLESHLQTEPLPSEPSESGRNTLGSPAI